MGARQPREGAGKLLHQVARNAICEKFPAREQPGIFHRRSFVGKTPIYSLWKSVNIHRDRQSKLAQEIGGTILEAMDTLNRNPQPFTAGIGEWQLHGEIGIYNLNRNPSTGKYHPVDIGSLMEQ